MKVSVLIENTSNNPNLAHEHGLSLYLETESVNILFDTGQSEKFIENAKKMDIDVSKADLAVISHGHYDHGGGLPHFLELNKNAPVYIHSEAFYPFYNKANKFIGLDGKLLENKRIVLTHEKEQIGSNLYLETKNTAKRLFSAPKQELKVLSDNKFKTDIFWHEQYLIITENNKKFLITGCCHKGILNLLNWFSPDVIIGGFHLNQYDLKNPEDLKELEYIADKMNEFPTLFYTGHCTGQEQFIFLHSKLGNKISYLSTGQQINF